MALYYPLFGFLLLFANLLQNPEDPYVSSDTSLMELVQSFLSPSEVRSTPFNANVTLKIFTELVNIARKFIDKVNSQGMNKAKRVRDKGGECDRQHLSMLSKEPADMEDSHNPAEKLAITDVRVCLTYINILRLPSSFSIIYHILFPMFPADFPLDPKPDLDIYLHPFCRISRGHRYSRPRDPKPSLK